MMTEMMMMAMTMMMMEMKQCPSDDEGSSGYARAGACPVVLVPHNSIATAPEWLNSKSNTTADIRVA